MLVASSLTHKGLIRPNNEDSLLCRSEIGLFAVADGLGGHAAGEVASRIAVEVLEAEIAPLLESEDTDPKALREAMVESVRKANRRIISEAEGNPKLAGMGTTLTALAVLPRDAAFVFAHAGDSRLYLFRESELKQLTRDHTYVQELVDKGMLLPEEAQYHPYKHALTRALGIRDDLEVDSEMAELKDGDAFLLCTDGLTNEVPDDFIAQIMSAHTDDPKLCAQKLVAQALSFGGRDNVTVVAVAFRTESSQ